LYNNGSTYESIVPQRVYMGDNTILKAINKRIVKTTMQIGGKIFVTWGEIVALNHYYLLEGKIEETRSTLYYSTKKSYLH
jgi:hypothetical protein